MRWIPQRRQYNSLTIAAMALAITVAFVQTANAERTSDDAARQAKRADAQTKRVGWEVAVGGMTTQQRAASQANLSTQLLLDMPDAALQDPIGVDLTEQDRDDLAVPYESGTPLRIGVVKEIAPNIRVVRGKGLNFGEIQETADGGLVWALSVQSPEAQAIRVHITDFSLPEGAEMYFYSVGGHADGPYTAKGRNGTGEFWTRSIGSSTGVIQLHFLAGDERGLSFTVSELAHIHNRRLDAAARSHDSWPCSDNVSCLVDANCVSGTPADPAKDAIGKMEWISGQFVNTCTGGLLADTDGSSQIPYFLTANHCFSANIANLETWFNYTTDSCNGVCPHNILTGGAPPSDTVGITVQATGAAGDFTLGTLDQAPPAGAVFLGWNNSPVAYTNGVPLYRFSNANFGPQVYSDTTVNSTTGTCGGWPRGERIYQDLVTGSTMGGSSGSPVLNASGEVVGQLSGCCGFSCSNECNFSTNWTVDGALAFYWNSVKDFLDPPPTGCTSDPECDDGLYCNGAETCDIPSGNCQAGTAPNCNDGVGCTDDSCNEGTNSCDNVANNANCDNGLWCDGAETCDVVNDCQSGTAPNCNDGVSCTTDSCNEGTNQCDNVPSNGLCDDGLFCNGSETCDAVNDCQAGTTVNCDDGVACTDDSCNEGTNSCDNIANDANCDDGLFCNGAETCDAVNDCQAGTDPCPGQSCDDVNNVCVDCIGDPDCDDGAYCNGAETCVGGTCQAGTAVNCDDGVGCTTDSCNEGTDSCDNIPSNGLCDDGLFCNGSETCDAVNDCQAGTTVNCDDGVACTDDSCNEGTNSCDNIANNANCDNGLFCDGAETCSATLDCQAGTDPCPGQICDEGTSTCNDCLVNADCDDGLFCNGAETCVGGVCQAGTAVNCDDGVGCTDDSCNEGTSSCDNIANDVNCDDGLYCNGAETCSATLDCLAGTVVNCDDGVGCTDDSCNEGTNSCDNIANDANCPDDGAFCNGSEYCDAVADCSSTGDPCAPLACDEVLDQCAGGATAQLEAGSVSVGAASVTVNLGNSYISPVVVCTIQYSNNTIPVVARVTAVTSTSFDVYLQNPGDLSTPVADNVSYLVVEEGTWTIDGVNVEAQTYLSTVTDENNSWVGEAQAYGQSYTSPVVVGQVMSVNDPDWSVFWCRGSSQTNPPSSTVLFTGKHVAEDPVVPRNNETIGFIVFESGHSTIGGVAFEAVLGADTVLGVTDAPPYTYTFNTAFASAPAIGVVNIGGMDGGNGGWGQIHGATLATTTTLFMSIDEDQINDAERNRTTDQIEYVVFEGPVVYPAAPQCGIPADCDDGLFCNGAEDCVAGSCVAGTPPNCSDGVACTDDSCNEGTNSCDSIANDANCDNGLFCDGSETCDAVLDCQSGTAVNCNDGVGCTDDSCNEGTNSCDNIANNANCDDGLFCNGAETCNATLDCQAGTVPNCDDGVGCTDDSCNEGTSSCDNIANNANCPDDGLFCNGTEYCDAAADCSSTGDPCLVSEVCNETTNTCDPGSAAKLESGTVSVGGTAVTVSLANAYTSPVVVCSVNYNNNTGPVVPRVTAVTSTSFDVYLVGVGGAGPVADLVDYLVVEEGAWTIDGVNIEAQTYLSTVTDENNSWVAQAQSYLQGYTSPVVLGQVMSDNDADWSVFWDQGSSRGAPPSATSLRTGKTVCEDTVVPRVDETIGFIVIEAGHGTIGGVEFEAALGADSVRGVTNAPPYTYTFNTAFASVPQVAVVTQAAMDGNNGGWAYTYGGAPLSATSLDLVIDEDQIGDTERNHTTEQVGYVVFELPIVYP